MTSKNLIRRDGSRVESFGFRPWSSLIDRFFDRWWNEFLPWSSRKSPWAAPCLDVCENDKDVVISAELPGMDERDIQASVSKDRVILQGEKKEESEEKNQGFHRHERSFGLVYREIDLPTEVNVDQAQAEFKNGILTLTLPKSEEAQSEMKKIPIKAA